MPPVPTCICGECLICRKRKANQGWRTRTNMHCPLSPAEKSAAARASCLARWKKAADNAPKPGPRVEPSDDELDRRAAEMLYQESGV